MPADADAAAHDLFAALRWFDDLGAHSVWLEQVPEAPQWEGVRDRIRRAAAGSPTA
jgi:L-threonylcarbamoyladenylate synthase